MYGTVPMYWKYEGHVQFDARVPSRAHKRVHQKAKEKEGTPRVGVRNARREVTGW